MSLSTERALNLLRVIEKAEEISQRELAERVDVSLGTANQTIRALVGEGILETNVVTTSKNKLRIIQSKYAFISKKHNSQKNN